MMKLLVVRVESALKSSLEKLSNRTGRSLSEVARDLALVGIDVKKSGDVVIFGPIGIKRRFASLSFGGKKEKKLTIWVGEELVKELEKEFSENVRGALREAIHLGLFRFRPEDVEIRGPFGVIRPFVTVAFSDVSERAREALRRLRSLPEK